MNFALVLNDPTNALGVTPASLIPIANALGIYCNRDVAPVYGGEHTCTVSDGTDLAPGEIVCSLVDALPDAPGAIAYHDVNGAALPIIFVALSLVSTVSQGSDSLSVALSHEMAETIGDPDINRWCDIGTGTEAALEACDAVEDNSYEIAGIAVSDFLLPAFFATGSPGPYSYLGTPTAPFLTAPGGYQIQRSSGTGEVQVTGAIHPLRMARRKHWSSRTFRRGIRLP